MIYHSRISAAPYGNRTGRCRGDASKTNI